MSEIINSKTVTLLWEEVEKLYSKVNDGSRYYVNSMSPEMVTQIAEQYFRDQGCDFWTMPEILNVSYKEGVDYTFDYVPVK